ncbi:DUF2380 domain-containing protein [Cystobacter fuscus]|nr:DUF2380 domain-containing protein [Cystobacter fuscus]
MPERLHHRRVVGGEVRRKAEEPAKQSAIAAHLAFLGIIREVSVSTRRISSALSRLNDSRTGIYRRHADLFIPSVNHGAQQLRWIDTELTATTRLANAASEVDDPDMQLALLRLGGPRLQSANNLPALIGHLTGEFAATRAAVRAAAEQFEKMLRVQELIEMLTTASAMKMVLPQFPPAAPASLGINLVMGANDVMMGTRIVVSAEWVEMMRRLVQAGIISLPVVGTAVRIHAGQMMMAQSHDELPKGVRDALGDGPEVRAMRQTGKAGAGMAETPRHHILPREFREWFEKRGFTGEMSIDQFCVKMEQAGHEAIHGGGDWRLGRQWPGEWNQMLMKALREAESDAGRMLTRNEILKIAAYRMRLYKLPMNFTVWGGQ